MFDKNGYSSVILPPGLIDSILKTGQGWSRFTTKEPFRGEVPFPFGDLPSNPDERAWAMSALYAQYGGAAVGAWLEALAHSGDPVAKGLGRLASFGPVGWIFALPTYFKYTDLGYSPSEAMMITMASTIGGNVLSFGGAAGGGALVGPGGVPLGFLLAPLSDQKPVSKELGFSLTSGNLFTSRTLVKDKATASSSKVLIRKQN